MITGDAEAVPWLRRFYFGEDGGQKSGWGEQDKFAGGDQGGVGPDRGGRTNGPIRA